jgi:hypothetical protein
MNSEVKASFGFKARIVKIWVLTLNFELSTARPEAGEWLRAGKAPSLRAY